VIFIRQLCPSITLRNWEASSETPVPFL
jgi:hypothetical protein